MSVGTFQSSVELTYWDFLLDGFSVFTLSWSARYRRFQTAAPTSSGASESTPWGSPGGWEEEPESVEKVGMSEINGGMKQQEDCRCTLYTLYFRLTRILCFNSLVRLIPTPLGPIFACPLTFRWLEYINSKGWLILTRLFSAPSALFRLPVHAWWWCKAKKLLYTRLMDTTSVRSNDGGEEGRLQIKLDEPVRSSVNGRTY